MARALAPALLLLAGLAGARAAAAQEAAAPGARALQALLEQARAGGLAREEVLYRLELLGPAAVGGVCALLSGAAPLTPGEEDLLLAALPRWPADEVAAELRAALPARPALDQRLLGVRLLGATGSADAVPHLVLALAAIEPEYQQTRLVREASKSAWLALFRADPEALAAMGARVAGFDPLLLPGLLSALASLEHGDAAPILGSLERWSPALDPLVLDALGRTPRWDRRVQDGSVTRLLRRRLQDDRAETRRAAGLALGRLRDAESVPELLLLLEHEPDARVRRAAWDALPAASGARALGRDLQRWAGWLADEELWLAEASGGLVAAALRGAPAEAAAALRELSTHPLHREHLALELLPALERPEEEVVLAACGALARLRACAPLRELTPLLDDPRPEVARAALAAVNAGTDGRFPESPEAWDAWIEAYL